MLMKQRNNNQNHILILCYYKCEYDSKCISRPKCRLYVNNQQNNKFTIQMQLILRGHIGAL